MEGNEYSVLQKSTEGKTVSKKKNRKTQIKWMDDVTDDLRRMEIRSWREKVRNSDQWGLIVEKAKTLLGL
jgi:hypothetical protein